MSTKKQLQQQQGIGFVPPGAKTQKKKPEGGGGGGGGGGGHRPPQHRRDDFELQFEEHFNVPKRIASVPSALIEAVNDFHYAMMNDHPRNEFYYQMLKNTIVPGKSIVLEIGAGSGLLSIMAGKLGAKAVLAVEGSPEMAELARRNVAVNQLQDRVTVRHMMSTDLRKSDLPGAPDILVSEIFGTLLLGESALDYITDVRQRLLSPTCHILPQFGKQFAVLVECPVLDSICSVSSWRDIQLQHVNALRDTCSCVFTKKYGFRMSSVPFVELSEPICVCDLDFKKDQPGFLPLVSRFPCKVNKTGTAHAMMLYWVATDPHAHTTTTESEGEMTTEEDAGSMVTSLDMSTRPSDTLNNFPRDMQWGQALQLLEEGEEEGETKKDKDATSTSSGRSLKVTAGENKQVLCRSSGDSVVLQFEVLKSPSLQQQNPPSGENSATTALEQ